MTNKENQEIERTYVLHGKVLDLERKELMVKMEEVRKRLEISANVHVAKYQKEYLQAIPEIENSYKQVIQPFWNRLNSSGIVEKIAQAELTREERYITDPISYELPSYAQRALSQGGIFPELNGSNPRIRKWLKGLEFKPCIIDALSVIDPFSPIENPEYHEELVKKSYIGEGYGFVTLDNTGFVIYRGAIAASERHHIDPTEVALSPLPNHIHPKVINEFANQIASGKSDEYIGKLLIKAQRRTR